MSVDTSSIPNFSQLSLGGNQQASNYPASVVEEKTRIALDCCHVIAEYFYDPDSLLFIQVMFIDSIKDQATRQYITEAATFAGRKATTIDLSQIKLDIKEKGCLDLDSKGGFNNLVSKVCSTYFKSVTQVIYPSSFRAELETNLMVDTYSDGMPMWRIGKSRIDDLLSFTTTTDNLQVSPDRVVKITRTEAHPECQYEVRVQDKESLEVIDLRPKI